MWFVRWGHLTRVPLVNVFIPCIHFKISNFISFLKYRSAGGMALWLISKQEPRDAKNTDFEALHFRVWVWDVVKKNLSPEQKLHFLVFLFLHVSWMCFTTSRVDNCRGEKETPTSKRPLISTSIWMIVGWTQHICLSAPGEQVSALTVWSDNISVMQLSQTKTKEGYSVLIEWM